VIQPLLAPIDGRQSETALQIARGMGRYCHALGMTALPEIPLRSGRRADLVALGSTGEIIIFEIKSSIADFRADSKWPDYRNHCDRLFFATSPDVPPEIFPAEAGLCVADAYGAEMLRAAPLHPLPAATRKEMLIRIARIAANRMQRLVDPALESLDQ
jgi:hypothetical protein